QATLLWFIASAACVATARSGAPIFVPIICALIALPLTRAFLRVWLSSATIDMDRHRLTVLHGVPGLRCPKQFAREEIRSIACDGDDAAFARLVERHRAWLFAAARRRLEDDHLADDAMQAVFIVLSTKARQLVQTETPSLAGWLFQVAHFTCSRLRRTRSRQRRW